LQHEVQVKGADMNKNTIALVAILLLIGAGLYALANYQHGKALPPLSAAPTGGGLVINGSMFSAPAALPAAPVESGATCP